MIQQQLYLGSDIYFNGIPDMPDLKPMNTVVLESTENGCFIIQHPDGYPDKKYNTTTILVNPEHIGQPGRRDGDKKTK